MRVNSEKVKFTAEMEGCQDGKVKAKREKVKVKLTSWMEGG